MKIPFKKKIIIALVILSIAAPLGLLSAQFGFAQTENQPAPGPAGGSPSGITDRALLQQKSQEAKEEAEWCFWSASCWVRKAVGGVNSIMIDISGTLFATAGQIFDLSARHTLNGASYGPNIGIVMVGWRIMRDLTNMIFIFILLFIAIATILQIETYGVKRFLPKVIAAAVLINFSLVITRAVIDVTNLLALQFANQFQMSGWELGKAYSHSLGTIATFESPGQAAANLSISNVIVAGFMGTILLLVGAIVLFLGAIFLIIRLVALWILMIFSPIGLVAAIIGIKKYGDLWWQKLLEYAIFAPAYLFPFYLVTKFVLEGGLESALVGGAASMAPQNLAKATPSAISALFQYFIVIALMIGSIIIAKMSGIYGANAVMGYARSGARFAAGAAGAPLGRLVRRYTTPQAEKLAKGGGGRFGKVLTSFPFMTRGLMAYSAIGKKSVAEMEKQRGTASNEALMKRATQIGTTREELAAIIHILTKRGALKENEDLGFTKELMKKGIGYQRGFGLDAEALEAERQRPEIALETLRENMRNEKFIAGLKAQYASKMPGLRGQYPGKTDEEIIRLEETMKVAKRIPLDAISKLEPGLLDDKEFFEALTRIASPSHMGRISENAALTAKVIDAIIRDEMGNKYKSVEKMADALQSAGKKSLAAWAASLQALPILKQYGLTSEKEEKRQEETRSKERAEAVNTADTEAKLKQALADSKPQDARHYDINFTASPLFQEFVTQKIQTMQPDEIWEFRKRKDDFLERMFANIKERAAEKMKTAGVFKEGDEEKPENIASIFELEGNQTTANWLKIAPKSTRKILGLEPRKKV